MNHPTPEACRSVAQVFYDLNEQFKEAGIDAQIDMMKPDVVSNDCGTVGCHGGWYALGKLGNEIGKFEKANYVIGASMMSEDLGISPKNAPHIEAHEKLQDWASDNPKEWGNDQGINIFSSLLAFFPTGTNLSEHRDTEDLSLFGDWWSGVADRVEQANIKAEKRRTGRNI